MLQSRPNVPARPEWPWPHERIPCNGAPRWPMGVGAPEVGARLPRLPLAALPGRRIRRRMPSRKHQCLVVLLTEHPRLLVELVRSCSGLDVPEELELLPAPEKVTRPTSDRVADGAVVVHRRGGINEVAFVLEVQLGKDERKRKSWPVYVVGTTERLGCPVVLVVVAPSERVARWAAKPIDLGGGRMVLAPLVIGPRQIPAMMSLEEARSRPDRLALSVIVHGQRRGALRLNRMGMQVARELVATDDRRSIVLADLIVASVRADVRRKASFRTRPVGT